MPELVEVERYRRLAETVVGCRIAGVVVADPRVLRGQIGPVDLTAALVGRPVVAARRRGKLLLVDTGPARSGGAVGPTLGLRFGMTGTLVVDGAPGVDRLVYSPAVSDERWVRFRLVLSGRHGRARELVLHDPRRLGRVQLDPPEEALGPDAAAVTVAQLRVALAPGRAAAGGRGTALKARLMDQGRLAGVGNLIADEVLWRAALSAARPAGSLTDAELRRLQRHLRATVADLDDRGGSHRGDLMPERHAGGRCPRDGVELARATVGGRTTWWCPAHQG